jgi:hypothetical protein
MKHFLEVFMLRKALCTAVVAGMIGAVSLSGCSTDDSGDSAGSGKSKHPKATQKTNTRSADATVTAGTTKSGNRLVLDDSYWYTRIGFFSFFQVDFHDGQFLLIFAQLDGFNTYEVEGIQGTYTMDGETIFAKVTKKTCPTRDVGEIERSDYFHLANATTLLTTTNQAIITAQKVDSLKLSYNYFGRFGCISKDGVFSDGGWTSVD